MYGIAWISTTLVPIEAVDELGVEFILGGGVEKEVLRRQGLHDGVDDGEVGQNLAHVAGSGHL